MLDGAAVLADTVVLTLTVRAAEPAACLFDMPVLEGQPPMPASPEAARFAPLDTITRGEVTFALAFPRPEGELPWTLVLNPGHGLGERIEVIVPEEAEP